MTDHDHDEWSPEQRDRLDALPRERTPPPGLKDRIGEELVRRGRLRRRSRAGGHTPIVRRTVRAAAALALFLAGGLVGRATAPGQSAERFAPATGPALAPAEHVQRVGSQYVEIVASLAAAVDTLAPGTGSQGREVALSTLRGAAEYIARMPGHDPRTERILLDLRSGPE